MPTALGVRLPQDARRPYRLLTSPRTRAIVACLRTLPETSLRGTPIVASHIYATPAGRVALVLREGTRVSIGAPEELAAKMGMLRYTVDSAADAGYPLAALERIELSAVVGTNDLRGEQRAQAPWTPRPTP